MAGMNFQTLPSAYASAISTVLPDCVQVADRFHLLQNLLERMKDIFKVEMPKEIFIQEGKVLDTPPEKVHREKAFAPSILESLDYDNSTPLDTEGRPIQFDDRKRSLNNSQYKKQAQSRKKNRS